MLPLSTDLVFAPTLAHWNSACALPSRPSQPDVAILRRCGLPLGYAMIVARRPRGLRGSFRPHLPWTEVEKPATTDSKEASLSVPDHENAGKPSRTIREKRADAAEKAPGGHAARTPDTMRGRRSFEAPRVERPARPCEARMLSRRRPGLRRTCEKRARNEGKARGNDAESAWNPRENGGCRT